MHERLTLLTLASYVTGGRPVGLRLRLFLVTIAARPTNKMINIPPGILSADRAIMFHTLQT